MIEGKHKLKLFSQKDLDIFKKSALKSYNKK